MQLQRFSSPSRLSPTWQAATSSIPPYSGDVPLTLSSLSSSSNNRKSHFRGLGDDYQESLRQRQSVGMSDELPSPPLSSPSSLCLSSSSPSSASSTSSSASSHFSSSRSSSPFSPNTVAGCLEGGDAIESTEEIYADDPCQKPPTNNKEEDKHNGEKRKEQTSSRYRRQLYISSYSSSSFSSESPEKSKEESVSSSLQRNNSREGGRGRRSVEDSEELLSCTSTAASNTEEMATNHPIRDLNCIKCRTGLMKYYIYYSNTNKGGIQEGFTVGVGEELFRSFDAEATCLLKLVYADPCIYSSLLPSNTKTSGSFLSFRDFGNEYANQEVSRKKNKDYSNNNISPETSSDLPSDDEEEREEKGREELYEEKGHFTFEDFTAFCGCHGDNIVLQLMKAIEEIFDMCIEESGISITANVVTNSKPHIDWQDHSLSTFSPSCVICCSGFSEKTTSDSIMKPTHYPIDIPRRSLEKSCH